MNVVTHLGCPLHYRIAGPAGGEPVVLIQGVGVHGDGWRPQVDVLSNRYQCLTFDNRGMGLSQPTGDGPVTVEQMAGDTMAIMDAVGWPSAHLVGHSLGGLIAQRLALSARKRIRSLSLLCTFADGRIPTRLSAWMIWVGMRTRIGPRRFRRRAFLQLVLPPDELAVVDQDALAAELAPFFGHDLADQPPIVMEQLRAMKRYGDATPRLGELAGVPTLVISAAHDRIAPPSAGRMIAAGIPGARYIEVPDGSHGLPIRRAEWVNTTLEEHLFRASGAG